MQLELTKVQKKSPLRNMWLYTIHAIHMNLSNSNLPSKIVSGFHLINHDKMKASKGGRSVHTHNTLETYFNHPVNSLISRIIITSTGFHSLLAHVRMSGVIGYNSHPKSWEPLLRLKWWVWSVPYLGLKNTWYRWCPTWWIDKICDPVSSTLFNQSILLLLFMCSGFCIDLFRTLHWSHPLVVTRGWPIKVCSQGRSFSIWKIPFELCWSMTSYLKLFIKLFNLKEKHSVDIEYFTCSLFYSNKLELWQTICRKCVK